MKYAKSAARLRTSTLVIEARISLKTRSWRFHGAAAFRRSRARTVQKKWLKIETSLAASGEFAANRKYTSRMVSGTCPKRPPLCSEVMPENATVELAAVAKLWPDGLFDGRRITIA